MHLVSSIGKSKTKQTKKNPSTDAGWMSRAIFRTVRTCVVLCCVCECVSQGSGWMSDVIRNTPPVSTTHILRMMQRNCASNVSKRLNKRSIMRATLFLQLWSLLFTQRNVLIFSVVVDCCKLMVSRHHWHPLLCYRMPLMPSAHGRDEFLTQTDKQ